MGLEHAFYTSLRSTNMADNTIIQQGRFTSDATTKIIQLRSDVDWMRVYNWTQTGGSTSTNAVEFYWQRGMAADSGIRYYRGGSNASIYSTAVTSNAFTLIDSTAAPLGSANTTVTAISTASLPIVSLTDTSGLVAGDVVRFVDVAGAQQLGGFDFTIDTVIGSTSFRLPYMAQLGGAGTTGSFRKVNYDTIFAPRNRYISGMTKASSMVVKMTVTHNMVVGQRVKLVVPSIYDMIEANGLEGNITAINTTTNTITLDIDSTAFTTFAFPATADVPFSPAIVIPFGENVIYPDKNDDSVNNTSYIGMKLAAGPAAPAGDTADVIYWVAGKSFSVTNE